MKYVFLIVIFLYSISGFSEIVATVGSYQISDSELTLEMQRIQVDHDMSFYNVRTLALENLIKKYILYIYADENAITVDDSELEAFFMLQLGDLERFQTNGFFDRKKYFDFGKTANGRKILAEMQKEILVNKTRTLIEDSFQFPENELLRRFLQEYVEVDLAYAIIDVEDANLPPEISMQEADRYYVLNRDNFDKKEQVKLRFFLVFKKDFSKAVAPLIQTKLNEMTANDSILSDWEINNLRLALETEETTKKALQKAKQLRELLLAGEKVFYPIIRTHYLSESDLLGNLPELIVRSAFQMKIGEYSEPVDFGDGFIVFQVEDRDLIARENELETANAVWKQFLIEQKNFQHDFQNYFNTHIDQFVVNTAIVNTINISRSSLFLPKEDDNFINRIREEIEENIDDWAKLRKIADQNKLKLERTVIYLEKFHNESPLQDGIAVSINRGFQQGFLPAEKGLVFFWVDSYFPEYIPQYDKIKDQLSKFVDLAQADTLDYKSYFENHKKDFMTPDSLQLGGVIFGGADNISEFHDDISEVEIRQIYERNIDDYFRKRSVKLNHIFVNEISLAEIIYEQLNSGINFDLLKYCFHRDSRFPDAEIIEYDSLPEKISTLLRESASDLVLKPIAYNNGWLIIQKYKDFAAGMIPLKEVEENIRHENALKLSDQYAFSAAKTIFDSTSYFSHLHRYLQPEQIFTTAYQDTRLEFEFVGSIKDYKTDLMKIWKNEKFSRIIKNDVGYAVIFVLKKGIARQLSFEESLLQIEDKLVAIERYKNARNYVNSLRDQIRNGNDPDSLLRYLKGWKRAEDLSLTSNIPGIDISEDIMNDILEREVGYCSPVIPVNENQMFFYTIERLKRPSQDEFLSAKNEFHRRLLQTEYRQWMEKYRSRIDIQKKF